MAGLWPDLTIEQVMMRSRGGLTQVAALQKVFGSIVRMLVQVTTIR